MRIRKVLILRGYGVFVFIVKDGVENNASSLNEIVSREAFKEIILFLETAFPVPKKRSILVRSLLNVIKKFPET